MVFSVISSIHRKGYKLVLDNAKALFRIAKLSAKEGEYGIASSLNILAAEEAVKAVVVLTKHYQPQMDPKEFNEVFTKHKSKHQLGAVLAFLAKYFNDFLSDMYEENKANFDLLDGMDQEKAESLRKRFKYFFEMVEKARMQKPKTDKFLEAFSWWNKVNDQKNRGLYVDLVNNKWHNPRETPKEQFETEHEYTSILIDSIESFNNFMTPFKLLRELKANSLNLLK